MVLAFVWHEGEPIIEILISQLINMVIMQETKDDFSSRLTIALKSFEVNIQPIIREMNYKELKQFSLLLQEYFMEIDKDNVKKINW